MATFRINSDGTFTETKKKKRKSTFKLQSDGTVTTIDERDDDIAPVKTTGKKEEKERDYWFEKGAFSDGYDLGDVTKSVLGTAADIGLGAVQGVGGMLEGVNDWAWRRTEDVAEALGADNFAKKAKGYADKESVKDLLKPAEDFVRPYSLAGGLVRQVSEGLGQVGGMMATGGLGAAAGLGAAGATALTTGTMFVSGAGSNESQAYKAGATEEEAKTYGAIAGAADAITELMFGGLGKSLNIVGMNKGMFSADDLLAKKVSDKFSSQIAKNFAEYGIKASGEGLEEVAAGLIQAVGKKVTYMDEEELGKIIEDEDLLNQFVVGAVTSGIVQSRGLVKSNKAGRDYVTGLTEDEQKVIDAEVGARTNDIRKNKAVQEAVDKAIADVENTKGKLTDEGRKAHRELTMKELEASGADFSSVELDRKEIAAIEKQVREDFDKGYISVDTIENTLFPENAKRHKELLEESKTADEARRAEINEEIKILGNTLNETLNKNEFLKESYRQRELKNQPFQVEVSETDGEMKKHLVEEFTKAGVGNDRRAHETFDFLNKLSTESNTKINVVTSEWLKKNNYDPTTEGFLKREGDAREIVINKDSPAFINSVMGHEVTHIFEGSEDYTKLQNILKEYATSKGEYDQMLQIAQETYKDVADAVPENEVTSQLVGKYIFTDYEFANNLSVKEPNIFKKVYDYIKHVYKMATAGSKEARQLEQAKRIWEKAYRETNKRNTRQTKDNSSTDTDSSISSRYSLKETAEITYETLTSKPDMEVSKVTTTTEDIAGMSRGEIVAEARKKLAEKVGKDEKGAIRIHNIDTGTDIVIGKPGLEHGLDRNYEYTAIVSMHLDEYLKNAVKVNEAAADDTRKHDSDILLGYGETEGGEKIPAYFVISKLTTGQTELIEFGSLYSLRAKKIAEDSAQGSPDFQSRTSATISIANLLDIVNETYSDILPKTVAEHYGNDRRRTKLGESVIFSLSAPVEESKDLLVLHNTSEQKLLKQLKLEGFPMPSLAVTNQPHTNFGSISIIFDKNTIDPKKNKKNKTYSADAWTPTVPATEYEVNSTAESNFKRSLIDLADNSYYSGEIERVFYETEDSLKRNNGYDGYIKDLAERPAIQYAFLKSKGEEVEIAQKEKEVELGFKMDERSVARYEQLINGYSGDIGELRQMPMKDMLEVDVVKEMLSKAPFTDRGRQSRFIDRITREAMAYQQYDPNAPANVEYIDDHYATNNEMAQRVDLNEVETWLRGISPGLVESEGIYNGKDYYTPSGNRRSFKQLHYPVTAENIVKAMQAQGEKSVTSFHGIKTLRATTAKTFKSIEEIRKSKDRLQPLTEAEVEKIHDELSTKMFEVFGKIIDENPKRFSKNDIFSHDHIGELFSEVGENVNASYIKGLFNKYGYEMSSETADESFKLLDAISAMPVYIFEAKPQRVVGYDEIKAVVIPEDSSEALRNALRERGIGFIEYDGTEADRQEKVNKAAEEGALKFSLSSDIAPSRGVKWSDILMKQESQPETAVETEAPAEEIAPVVIPEELRYEEGRPLTEEDLPNFEQERSWSFDNITEADAPEEIAPIAPEYEPEIEPVSPLEAEGRDMKEVGKRNIKAYMYENPEVRPFFQRAAEHMLHDLQNSVKGEKHYNDELYYISGGEQGFWGTKRQTSAEIAELLDDWNYSYADIEKGLKAIIEDHGAENNAISKRIEFMLDKRLREGYTDAVFGDEVPADEDYLNLLREKQITEYSDEAYEAWLKTVDFNEFAPMEGVQKQYNPDTGAFEGDVQAEAKAALAKARTENKLFGRESNFDSHDFTESRGVQQEYDAEAEEIVDSTHDIELERLEKRKKKALDDLGDLTSYTKQQAQALYDEVRMMQKGKKVSGDLGFILDRMFEGVDKKADNYEEVKDATYKRITDALLAIERSPAKPEREVPPAEKLIRNSIETKYGWRVSEIEGMKLDTRAEERRKLRKQIIGVNLTEALDKAKNISMMLMNNTDTIRNTELVFGRENGKIINEAIFQKEIDNEAKSIAWQNKERFEIKELGIKARSKESAAVQKYGEKQYVNEFGDLVKYGDDELAAEFSDVETQAKIRKAARIIREKYDAYIDLANETLTKLGFDPIKKRNDYMRHFQELNDVFSRYGIPFNAQAMQEHDLPTDINGLTDSWSPQKNYFANMQPRKGQRTTLDAVTGIDGYIGGIANLIYHTEDIQRGRAFEEIIRETYGQEKGWENLEALEGLSPEEYQARADKIQDNHLSNYAAWVHEWTNNVAGKKSKVDRSIESMFGRKAFALLDQVRKQVGSNMIGMNLSSSLTNLIAPVQAASKTKKLAVVKGTADTIKNIFVKDDFMEKNSFLTARMGTDMLSKNAWQKIQDAGYVFMKGMDWFSSNQIVRSKYYELLSKGMSEEQAHAEAGKFAARIMGDRTKGAQAQLYNSKLIGLVTQFQLEVNNQLYSMFYDTYHESKEAAKNNAAKTAAGMTFTLGQLAAMTHVFGQTFESIAGYNPTFDIIGIIATALGAGDDDDEKTTSERLKNAADKLVDALPYVNVLSGGGRIPIASGIPNLVGVATGGKDDYGNELTLEDELAKLRYLVLPTGGNQIKKTMQGLQMFDEDLPVSGSYTDSGNLRFPVEDTPLNRVQAGLFGQWASGNAKDYFDNERQPLKEKQIQEYKDLDIPIADYWEYREGLKEQKTVEDKFDYVAGLDLPVAKKNIMINNIVDRDEKVDLINYDDFGSYEEFDWATKNPEKYDYLQSIGASYKDYAASEESKEAYNWAYKNPEGYTISKAVAGDVVKYRKIASDLYDIKADKDENGKSISGSRKEKVAAYINSMDADYGSKIILFKSEYPSDDTYNYEIIDYLNNRQDISYGEMQVILTELGFTVDDEGNITW